MKKQERMIFIKEGNKIVVFDSDGNKHLMLFPVDATEAIDSGMYFIDPPNEKKEEVKTVEKEIEKPIPSIKNKYSSKKGKKKEEEIYPPLAENEEIIDN